MRVTDGAIEVGENGRREEGGEDGESPVEEDGPVAQARVEVYFGVVNKDLEAVLDDCQQLEQGKEHVGGEGGVDGYPDIFEGLSRKETGEASANDGDGWRGVAVF